MSESPPADELLFERRGEAGEVGWLTFNRPQARNAITFAMYDRLAELCAELNADASVRVLVLTGAGGKAFVAGTDISQFREFKSPDDALGYEQRVERVIGALETVRVPTLAAIGGACTGGGGSIAAACDLRIASPSARFGFPVARTLGNTLSLGNYTRLAALLGIPRAKDLVFTARLMDAEEMLRIGLVSELVSSEEALVERAMEMALAIAALAPITLQTAKEAFGRVRARLVPPEGGSDLIVRAYMSEDFQEGVKAFGEKRAPVWRGR